MPFLAAVLALMGLTPAPVARAPLPRQRRKPSRSDEPTPATEIVAPEPVAPAPLPRVDLKRLAFPSPLPASKSVRILQHAAGLPVQQDGLGGGDKSPTDAREALGRDLSAYVDLCIAAGTPLPSQTVGREHADDAAYRGRLRRACVADLDLWERARARRERERAEANEDGRKAPPALYVPEAVVQALAARKAARDAEQTVRRGERGAGAPPTGPKPALPTLPAGPKR